MRTNPTFTDALWALQVEYDKHRGKEVGHRPECLPATKLKTLPALFQPREGMSSTGATSEDHVNDLVQQLRNKPVDRRVLDPIIVYGAGSRFYVVDGHHRLAAYRKAGVDGLVPVKFFEGTPEEAVGVAIAENAKIRLNMTREDKNEAAWRMVVMDRISAKRLTKDQIAEQSGVSPRSVARMRDLYDRLQAVHGRTCDFSGERLEADLGTYMDALKRGRATSGEWTEELEARMVEKMRQALGKALGKEAHKHPDQFADAVELYLGRHAVEIMVERWGYVPAEPNLDDLIEGPEEETSVPSYGVPLAQ
jgi:ParB-like chromosome segregation protein Spo0J